MNERVYCYEADWRNYAFPQDSSRFMRESELEDRYSRLTLRRGVSLPTGGGLPILSDGETVLADTENEMSMIFGSTGSGKTRKLILPLLAVLAQAGESMVVLDIKGELSSTDRFPQIRGVLEENGYHCVFLNFRSKDGDGYNILEEPYQLYRSGKRDEAISMVNDLADAFANIYGRSTADPFWVLTAKQYFVSTAVLLFEFCDRQECVNLLTLASYTSYSACEYMEELAKRIRNDNSIMTMLRSVVSEPEKTRMSTLATVNSFFTSFITDEKLLRMLNFSTFDLHDIYRRPTALFLIVPDEVDTYSGIVGMLLNQFKAALVSDAYWLGGTLPRRVNFVCDEFCNYYIPGMKQAISTHKSRNIRWFMVCQSLKQLKTRYPEEADTILANCNDLFFLSSPEQELLEYLSARAGKTNVSETGMEKPLISVSSLQGLRRGREASEVYFTSGNRHFVSFLPDITCYPYLQSYTKQYPRSRHRYPPLQIYSVEDMMNTVERMYDAAKKEMLGQRLSKEDRTLAQHLRNLFKPNRGNETKEDVS